MAEAQRLICASEVVQEGGDGVRFRAATSEGEQEAFVVRFEGVPRAFLNRCAHVGVELDWNPGKFFDDSGLYLVCATHGALYEANDGRCAGGPCRGMGLMSVAVVERDGKIFQVMSNG